MQCVMLCQALIALGISLMIPAVGGASNAGVMAEGVLAEVIRQHSPDYPVRQAHRGQEGWVEGSGRRVGRKGWVAGLGSRVGQKPWVEELPGHPPLRSCQGIPRAKKSQKTQNAKKQQNMLFHVFMYFCENP